MKITRRTSSKSTSGVTFISPVGRVGVRRLVAEPPESSLSGNHARLL